MADGDAVRNVEFTMRFAIREWEFGDDVRYDWIAQNGEESDETFDTLAEAELDIRDRFR